MASPFFLRILYCIPALDDAQVKEAVGQIKISLRATYPQLKDAIVTRNAARELSQALNVEVRELKLDQQRETYVLALLADVQYIGPDIASQLTKLRNAAAEAGLKKLVLVLYTNVPSQHISTEIGQYCDDIIFAPGNDILRNLSAFRQRIEDYIQRYEIREQSSTQRPSVESQHHPAMPTAPKSPPAPSFSASIGDAWKAHVSPVIYRYQPLPPRERDPNPQWWYPENVQRVTEGVGTGWTIAGASRRGLSHWHTNAHRDDAFAFNTTSQWNIIAVADGAGGSKASRVTANESTRIAVETIQAYQYGDVGTQDAMKSNIRKAMLQAVSNVYDYQIEFNRVNHFDKSESYCTFMLLIHQPLDDGSCLYGVFHVGDGYMMAATPSMRLSTPISTGDHGVVSNESHFFLSFPKAELLNRVTVHESTTPLEMFLIVTDGIEEDFKPSHKQDREGVTKDTNFERFAFDIFGKHLIWPETQDWGQILDWLISYEKKGSNDDRTLVVLSRQPVSS